MCSLLRELLEDDSSLFVYVGSALPGGQLGLERSGHNFEPKSGLEDWPLARVAKNATQPKCHC